MVVGGAVAPGARIDQSMATSRRNRESDVIDSSRQEFCTPLLGLLRVRQLFKSTWLVYKDS